MTFQPLTDEHGHMLLCDSCRKRPAEHGMRWGTRQLCWLCFRTHQDRARRQAEDGPLPEHGPVDG